MLVEFIAAEVEKEKEKGKDENDNSVFSWRAASVLELGSGPGLTGIAVAALKGSRVLLTDLEGPALTLARKNVEENAAEIERGGGSVAVAPLPWGERGAARRARSACSFASSPTVVIAADVIYDGALFSPLLETLEELAFGESKSDGSGDTDNGNDNTSASTRAHPPPSPSPPSPPPRILIAHVRRWKRDARFWAAARKRFEVIDVTPGKRSEKAGEGGEEGESGSKTPPCRYSSHEKGALRVFELVPKINSRR